MRNSQAVGENRRGEKTESAAERLLRAARELPETFSISGIHPELIKAVHNYRDETLSVTLEGKWLVYLNDGKCWGAHDSESIAFAEAKSFGGYVRYIGPEVRKYGVTNG